MTLRPILDLPPLTLDPTAPETWPDRLREVAKMLDLTDKMAVILDRQLRREGFDGPVYVPGDSMQRDLLSLADWLERFVRSADHSVS